MGTFEIMDQFNKLSDKDKIHVLYEALGNMETYNGRTKTTCICLAMDYKTEDGEKWQKRG